MRRPHFYIVVSEDTNDETKLHSDFYGSEAEAREKYAKGGYVLMRAVILAACLPDYPDQTFNPYQKLRPVGTMTKEQ